MARFAVAAGLLTACLSPAFATIPYSSAGGPFPGFGPGVIDDDLVGGKEYSHDRDHMITAVGVAPDPQQIVAWDGVGGVVDVADYTGTRPDYTPEDQIDAIANQGDFAYRELKDERAHLLFSLDDAYHVVGLAGGGVVPMALPPGLSSPFPGPGVVTLGNGNTVGGSGEISYELGLIGGNPPDTQGVWAIQSEVNGMPFPEDVDGLEVWGPEPPLGDANKYSLEIDAASGVSVWNASGSAYIPHATIVAAVTSLLPGDPPSSIPLEEAINLDALMVQDVIGSPDEFERSPAGPGLGDEIIFSIRQIPNPADPDGFYATGSELFVLNAGGLASHLTHGGHVWDHAYSLAVFGGDFVPGQQVFAYDINAIEAVGEFAVPEPVSSTLLVVAIACMRIRYQRR
ncbi:MAG: hypothetical protein AAF266_07765 [Planctomycetota bacterium]